MKMKDTNEKQPEETDQQSYTDSQPETETDATTAKLPEYFSMKLLPLIHEVYAGENYQMQRKSISKSIDEDLKQRMIHSKLSEIRLMRTHWC